MAAHKGKIYLAGGSHATNEKGKKSNLSSLADVSVFDVKTKKWSKVTPLPEPRSSHELVAYKGKLYVIGDWLLISLKIRSDGKNCRPLTGRFVQIQPRL
jgi:N-acetylneuraminic acid mutarotase